MSRETNMTVGRPTKLILGLAVPLILTNVGQQLYTVADASIVGRGVGVEALAALGATDWLYWLVLWTVQAMTQGFSVLVSQTFGSNDKKGLRKAITMSVLLCAAVNFLSQRLTVERLDHGDLIYYIFNLVDLQPSDEINLKSCVQIRQFFQRFLYAVFAERTLPIFVGFFDLIDGVVFAHRNELHRTIVRMTRSAVVFNMFMDGFKIFCN